MVANYSLSVQKGCKCIILSRAAYYRRPQKDTKRNTEVIKALNELVERHGKCYLAIRRKGKPWNHKRVYRVY